MTDFTERLPPELLAKAFRFAIKCLPLKRSRSSSHLGSAFHDRLQASWVNRYWRQTMDTRPAWANYRVMQLTYNTGRSRTSVVSCILQKATCARST